MQLCLCRILQIDEVTLYAMLQRVLVDRYIRIYNDIQCKYIYIMFCYAIQTVTQIFRNTSASFYLQYIMLHIF